jgi:hypothetical protein
MPSVQPAGATGDGEVEGRRARRQGEVLDRHLQKRGHPGGYLARKQPSPGK